MVELRVLLLLVFFPGNTAHWGFSSTTNQSSKPSNMSSADWELLLLGFQRAITPCLGPLVLGTLRLLRKIFGTTNRGFWCSGTPLAQPHNICSVFFFSFSAHKEPKAHRQKWHPGKSLKQSPPNYIPKLDHVFHPLQRFNSTPKGKKNEIIYFNRNIR